MLVGILAVVLGGAGGYRHFRPHDTVAQRIAEIAIPDPDSAVACPWGFGERPLMLLVLGQSNAGNHGQEKVFAAAPAYFFFDGHCYLSNAVAPGATGYGSNIWTYLSPMLTTAVRRKVVYSVLAVESSSIADWTRDGPLRHRLAAVIRNGRESGFSPDLVLWQQGEADAMAGTSSSEYRKQFAGLIAFIRAQGLASPVLAALSTRCRNEGSQEVRAAIRETALGTNDIILGPDTDALNGASRHDGCHFSASGLSSAASLWVEPIMAALRLRSVVGIEPHQAAASHQSRQLISGRIVKSIEEFSNGPA